MAIEVGDAVWTINGDLDPLEKALSRAEDLTAKAAEAAAKAVEKAAQAMAASAERTQQKRAEAAEKAADREAKAAEKAAQRAEKASASAASKAEKDRLRETTAAERNADREANASETAAQRAIKASEREAAAAERAAARESKAAERASANKVRAADRASRQQIEATERAAQKSAAAQEQAAQRMARAFDSAARHIGAVMTAAGAAISAGLVHAVNAAIDWESAFTGVIKTVDATDAELAELAKGIRDMAMEIPVAANELAKFAEIGGQMGVPKDQILAFTRVIAILGETTNIAGEEGAAMLAQFANVAGVPQGKYSNLAATIVALGNAGTSTEAEILQMGQRLAAAGKIAGMTAGEILGLSNSLVGVGIEAEAGGTAFSKVIIDMTSAVMDGGIQLNALAKVAGVSAQEFSAAFNESPAKAIELFVKGLARMQGEGQNVFKVLDTLGYTEIRMRNALLSSAQAADALGNSFSLGNKAFEENAAHTKEAETRFATLASQIQIAKNQFNELALVVGEIMTPRVAAITEQIGGIIDKVIAWTQANPELTARIVELSAVIGAIMLALGPLIMLLPGIAAAFSFVGSAIAFATAPSWPLIAAIAAIGAGLVALGMYLYQNFEAWGGWSALWEWIMGIVGAAKIWLADNWSQLTEMFNTAKDGLLVIGGMLWEGLRLGFELLWNILSAVFGEIGEGWQEMAGTAGDESKSWLDTLQILQEDTLKFLTELSAMFNRFVEFVNWAWPAIALAAEIGANLFIEPVMWMVGRFKWAVDYITLAMGKLGGAWDWLTGAGGGMAGGVNISGPVGLASGGTVQQSGWALVGEMGPELLQLPRGATVYDNQQTQQAMQGGGSQSITINFGRDSVRSADDIREIERGITRILGNGLQAAGVRML